MDGYKVVLTRNGVEESFHDINIVHSKSPERYFVHLTPVNFTTLRKLKLLPKNTP